MSYGYRWYVAPDDDNEDAEGLDLVVVAEWPGSDAVTTYDVLEVRVHEHVFEWDDDEGYYVFSEEQVRELENDAREIARDMGWTTRGTLAEAEELLDAITSGRALGPTALLNRMVMFLREICVEAREALGDDV
jgi:hypothetical protein